MQPEESSNQPRPISPDTANPAALSDEAQVATTGSLPLNSGESNTPASSSLGFTPESFSSQSTVAPQPKKKNKKKLLLLIVIPLILLSGVAGAYFGYYLPNKPENIWRTALDRTGKGYDKLTDYIGEEQKYSKGVKVDGSFKVNAQGFTADGSIKGVSDDKKNSDFTGNISAAGVKVDFDFKTIASLSTSPDLYFRVGGLKGLDQLLGVSSSQFDQALSFEYSKILKDIDNQWYFVDHTLFDQYVEQEDDTTGLSITQKDVSDLLKAIGEPTKKYIFTSNQSDMAIEVRQKVGKENQDGKQMYHFKVGINKENLKKWNKEVCDQVQKSKLYKMLSDSIDPETLSETCYDGQSIDSMDNSKTADAWVDTKTKLIHKIRFTVDSKVSQSYFGIIQNYNGGNKLPITLAFQDKQSETSNLMQKLNLNLDMDSGELKIDGELKQIGQGTTNEVTFNLVITPNTTPVNVQKPSESKNILQLMDDLGLGGLLQQSSSSQEIDLAQPLF